MNVCIHTFINQLKLIDKRKEEDTLQISLYHNPLIVFVGMLSISKSYSLTTWLAPHLCHPPPPKKKKIINYYKKNISKKKSKGCGFRRLLFHFLNRDVYRFPSHFRDTTWQTFYRLIIKKNIYGYVLQAFTPFRDTNVTCCDTSFNLCRVAPKNGTGCFPQNVDAIITGINVWGNFSRDCFFSKISHFGSVVCFLGDIWWGNVESQNVSFSAYTRAEYMPFRRAIVVSSNPINLINAHSLH